MEKSKEMDLVKVRDLASAIKTAHNSKLTTTSKNRMGGIESTAIAMRMLYGKNC